MKTFRFETTATMKPYNNNKWWIDGNIVRSMEIDAENVKNALAEWREKVQSRDYIEISKNALKEKQPMYIDNSDGTCEQIGYVITGKTMFDKGDYSGYVYQFIELWVKIVEIVKVDF